MSQTDKDILARFPAKIWFEQINGDAYEYDPSDEIAKYPVYHRDDIVRQLAAALDAFVNCDDHKDWVTIVKFAEAMTEHAPAIDAARKLLETK